MYWKLNLLQMIPDFYDPGKEAFCKLFVEKGENTGYQHYLPFQKNAFYLLSR